MSSDKISRTSRGRLANRLASRWRRALHGEAGAGLLLMLAAALAMAMANGPWAHGWHDVWHGPLGWTPLARLSSLGHWIDDGLMAVFFFAVGLEIKREAVAGDLSHPRLRRLPVLAAAMGMALPALVFLLVTRGHPQLAPGWAIPAATDIAFALGVLGLGGKGLPGSLRLFLLGLAVVDDLGAVAIIAGFYGGAIQAGWLAAGAAVLAGMVLLNRLGSRWGVLYITGAVLLWFCVLHSGVHATVAGVLAALTVPVKLKRHGDSLLLRIEHAVAPWCSYGIAPLFALASAGVPLAEVMGAGSQGHRVAWAVAAGLVLGKQAGVLGAVILAERSGLARRPEGATLLELWGVALLAGVGFTMSLFIAALAFPRAPELAAEARLGILGGSLVSALAGFVVLRIAAGRRAAG
jgi:NhaA family Na+:H+ antiporter